MSPSAWCAQLSDAEFSRIYAAVASWAHLDTSDLFEENLVFRLGTRLHAEAERRGTDKLQQWTPPGFDWPFHSWESFKKLADDKANPPEWLRKAMRGEHALRPEE